MRRTRLLAATVGCIAFTAIASAWAYSQSTTRLTLDRFGNEIPGGGGGAFVSANGLHVAFWALGVGVTADDQSATHDVFVRSLGSGRVVRVSLPVAGIGGTTENVWPVLSADGRFVAYLGHVPGPVRWQILVTDRDADDNGTFDELPGVTSIVSVDPSGGLANATCAFPSISADGRFVAFCSAASNLVPGDSSSSNDFFVHDRISGETTCVSVTPSGRPGTASNRDDLRKAAKISDDGRFVVFRSDSRDLVVDDSNGGEPDVFVRDRETSSTTRLNVDSTGYDVALSGDGRYVAFSSWAPNVVPGNSNGEIHVYVRDMATGVTDRVSVASNGSIANSFSALGALSADGRWVVFLSRATNLGPIILGNWYNSYVHDRLTGSTTLVSRSTGGAVGNGFSEAHSISSSGRLVALHSDASNLVGGDTNGAFDAFVRAQWSVAVGEVLPAEGADLGGDFVHVRGEGFTEAATPRVWFGSAEAEIVSAAPDHLVVRTPPGSGVVPITVVGSGAPATLPSAYTYVDAAIAARWGNVGEGGGDRENVLLVTGSTGSPRSRELRLVASTPVLVVMVPPSSQTTARFVLYGWAGWPDPGTLVVLPRRAGRMVLPVPFVDGAPQPSAIWNNLAHGRTLGRATLPSRPAPTVVVRRPSGLGRRVQFTLQGLVEDDASPNRVPLSITNAVLVRVE